MANLIHIWKKLGKMLHESNGCSYICIRFGSKATGAHSSAGSEHLPYKQGVGGSNPSAPTERSPTGGLFYLAHSSAGSDHPAQVREGRRFESSPQACGAGPRPLKGLPREAFFYLAHSSAGCKLPVACCQICNPEPATRNCRAATSRLSATKQDLNTPSNCSFPSCWLFGVGCWYPKPQYHAQPQPQS
jgi:hypothetical protein